MNKPPKPFNAHRLARLIVCAQALFAWAAAVWFSDKLAGRRHIRQRYRMLSLDRLAVLVRNLMIAHTGEMVGKRRRRRPWRNDAPSGFRRRTHVRSIYNAIAGSRLRRFLREGDFAARFWRLADVIFNIDHYCRRFLLRRALNGVNRLRPILIVRPPHGPARSLAAPAIAFADSS
jgi:hypothetical protein